MTLADHPGENGSIGQLFLQQAETVRLICPGSAAIEIGSVDGEKGSGAEGGLEVGEAWHPLSVTDVEGGESLLLREISRGTHVGQVIDAIVTET